MVEDQPSVNALRASDPGDVQRLFGQENLQRLANAVSPHLSAGARTLVYVLSMPSRIGHLALEPHALFNLYGDRYDQLVVVSRKNPSFPASQGVSALASHYVTFAETPHSEVAEMGHHDGNLQDFGIFSFAIASPQGLFAQFVEAMADGARPKSFVVPAMLRERADVVLSRLGIGPTDRVVALHVRTAGTHVQARYHDYRNASLENYQPLLRYLLGEGYWVIRLGDRQSQDLPLRHPRLIDLPKIPRYENYLDVAVVARADFAIACDSGPEAICRLLGTPMLRANCAATHHVWLHPNDLLLFKTYHCRRRGRGLSYRELLFEGMSCVTSSEELERRQIDLLENTPDELLAAGRELIDRLAGRYADDLPLQERFRAIGNAFGAAFKTWPPERRQPGAPRVTCYGYGLPWTRYARSYSQAHPGFID